MPHLEASPDHYIAAQQHLGVAGKLVHQEPILAAAQVRATLAVVDAIRDLTRALSIPTTPKDPHG